MVQSWHDEQSSFLSYSEKKKLLIIAYLSTPELPAQKVAFSWTSFNEAANKLLSSLHHSQAMDWFRFCFHLFRLTLHLLCLQDRACSTIATRHLPFITQYAIHTTRQLPLTSRTHHLTVVTCHTPLTPSNLPLISRHSLFITHSLLLATRYSSLPTNSLLYKRSCVLI